METRFVSSSNFSFRKYEEQAMADKQFTCPHCRKKTTVEEMSYDDIVEKAGKISAITFLATLVTLPIGGIGGLLSGIYFSTTGVYNYASIDCTNPDCGKRFPVAKWTDGD